MKYRVRDDAAVIDCGGTGRSHMSGVSSGIVKHLGGGGKFHDGQPFVNEGDVVVFQEGDGVVDLPDGTCVVVSPSAIMVVVEEAETEEEREWLADIRDEADDD